jgi:hypothetical protein
MEKKKPAPSLDFLKAHAIRFVGVKIWRFSHLHKSGNFSTSMVILKIKLKKLCAQNRQNSRKLPAN